MEYLLFSYPNCQKCVEIKGLKKLESLKGEEYDISRRENVPKIREYLNFVKRDDKGSIILPTLIFLKDGEVAAVLNSKEEVEAWLRSKD
jgi:hypothetical protein